MVFRATDGVLAVADGRLAGLTDSEPSWREDNKKIVCAPGELGIVVINTGPNALFLDGKGKLVTKLVEENLAETLGSNPLSPVTPNSLAESLHKVLRLLIELGQSATPGGATPGANETSLQLLLAGYLGTATEPAVYQLNPSDPNDAVPERVRNFEERRMAVVPFWDPTFAVSPAYLVEQYFAAAPADCMS